MTRMRQRIAQRLKDSQNTYAMLTTFNEVDMRLVFLMANRLLARWASRRPVDSHLVKKIVIFSFLAL